MLDNKDKLEEVYRCSTRYMPNYSKALAKNRKPRRM
jgi:hypothetical protein